MEQQKKLGKFDMKGYLAESNLKLVDVTTDGKYVAQDVEGNTGELDVQGIVKELGIPLDKVDIEFNSPDEPLETSPVSLPDRARLEFGNEKGSISFLKNKFEAVVPHPEKGLLVKNKGVWQQVDPTGLGEGDPWKMAQELGADLVETTREAGDIAASFIGGIAGGAAGATAGAAVGLPTGPGAVATAGMGAAAGAVTGRIAGVATNSFLMSSLGRYLGTYEATPDEQVQDAGIEATLALAGELIIPGGKLVVQGGKQVTGALGRTAPAVALKKAFKEMSTLGDDISKGVLASFVNFFSGTPSKAAGRMIDHIDAVDKEAGNIIKSVRAKGERLTVEAIDDVVGESQIKRLGTLADNYEKQVGKKFKALEAKMIANPQAEKFSANLTEDLQPTIKSLTDMGVVSYDEGAKEYIVNNKEEIATALLGEKPVANMTSRVTRSIENVVSVLNKHVNDGEVVGRDGLEKVLNVRRTIDDMYFDLASRNTNSAKEYTKIMQESVFEARNSLVKRITDSGLGAQYKDMNKFWTDNLPVRALARQVKNTKTAGILDPEKGLNSLYHKLNSGKEANIFMKRIETMGEVAGGLNKGLADDMLNREAAKHYSATMPNIHTLAGGPGLVVAGVAGGLGYASTQTDNPYIDAMAGVAAATVFPRGARNVAKVALKAPTFLSKTTPKAMMNLKNTLIGLGNKERGALLSSPETLIRTVTAGMGEEDAQEFMQLFQEHQSLR